MQCILILSHLTTAGKSLFGDLETLCELPNLSLLVLTRLREEGAQERVRSRRVLFGRRVLAR
jgi:hypothetical protein